MPKGLRRLHGGGDLHFITCSCYHRLKFLGSASRRDLFLRIFEEVRQKYDFVVVGYVVMPEHFHILVSEPRIKTLSIAMQVLKQRVSLRYPKSKLAPTFWQPRYYDFNVFTNKKKVEKLRYMHRNPVKRGLVESPDDWLWSSWRDYRFGEPGPVRIGE
jgi:putative transposase